MTNVPQQLFALPAYLSDDLGRELSYKLSHWKVSNEPSHGEHL